VKEERSMEKVIRKIVKWGVISVFILIIIGTTGFLNYVSAESTLHEVLKRGTLRFGWAVWWPYVYRDAKTGQLTGISVDLAEEMAKALNVKLEWVEDSWGTFAAGLQAHKFDIWNLVAITLPRATASGFTEPLTVHGLSIIVKKAEEPNLKSWKDLDRKGKKISVTLGSNTDMYLTRAIKEAEIVRLKTPPEGFTAMKIGKTNGYASTIDSLKTLIKDNPDTYILPGEFGRSPVSFAVRQDDQVWINWLNLFVREVKSTGAINNLLKKYGLDASFAAD
jgi:ABC-type amino acid transport substrate-binding protein